MEQIEDRVLLTGNVLIAQSGSSLTITGDTAANEIAFVPGAADNSIVIVGLSGTSLNGASTFQMPSGISSIKMNLGDGNDVVRVDDVNLGSLVWNMGNGDDLVEVERHDTRGVGAQFAAVNIKGFAGNDTFRFGIASDADNQVKVNSKFAINGGKGNDRRSSLTSNQLAGKPKAAAIEVVESDPATSGDHLATSLSDILVNQNEQVDFQVELANPAVGTVVKLFNANSSGNPVSGGFLADLFDDGSPLHKDSVAGDGIFSNTLAVNFDTLGDHFYAAQVQTSGGSVAQTLSTHITAVSPPTQQMFEQFLDEQNDLQAELDAAIAGGQSVADALEDIRIQLLNLASVVDTSIAVTEEGIFWETTDGELLGILALDPTGNTHSRPQSDTSGTDLFAAMAAPAPVADLEAAADAPKFKGDALILAPFFYEFEKPNGGDESNDIAQILNTAGIKATLLQRTSENSSAVGIDSFKGLGQYDVVSISTHGAVRPGLGEIFFTGQKVKEADTTDAALIAEYKARRLTIINGYWSVTPAFITYYSGQMDDTIVYASVCKGAEQGAMAGAFLGRGADAFIGYTAKVDAKFSNAHGISLFNYLTADEGNKVSGAPGINVDIDPESEHAHYVYFGDPDAKLPTDGDLLKNTQLFVSYTWSVTQRDLDSNTQFVGSSVGYATPGPSTYLTFSGDNTSSGGAETVYVNLNSSYQARAWGGSVDVDMNAGWYIPAGGSGPALLTVAFYNTETQEYTHVTQRTINPGQQSGAASARVGTAHIVVTLNSDDPDEDTVEFMLI